ncbi:MAG: FecR domain-containing protein [Chitinophagaceae bacterium]|nr:FecR domain-containing protein [Chitinophagaceae bacterium]
MPLTRIQILTELVVAGKASAAEQLELAALIDGIGSDEELSTVLQQAFAKTEASLPMSGEMRQKILTSILAESGDKALPKAKLHSLRFTKWVAAAAALIAVGTVIFFMVRKPAEPLPIADVKKEVIQPGKQGAVLTLADGRQIVLDSSGNGIIAQQSGTEIRLQNGTLAYDAAVANGSSFNTIATPAGRQYQVVLPDGSHVWLNAGSSLKYPTAFTEQTRKVELTGEAYFEVAKKAKQQFQVAVNGSSLVDVLGTSFNIDAYQDGAAIKTTLLDGAVKVSNAGSNPQPVVLKPGQQSQQHGASGTIEVLKQVDIDNVMAWKNNKFNFEGIPLKEIMKQLERWYDIEVVYEGPAPVFEFYGELSRNNSLNDILEAFKDSDLHFRLEGRKLIIMK